MTRTDTAPHRDRRADAWLVALSAGVGAAAIALASPRAVDGDPTVEVVTQVLLALTVGTGIVVVVRRFAPGTTGALVALLTGIFLCAGAAIITNATPFAPLGVVADQGYRTAYLTRFGHGWELVDYAYKDLPSFYPPLFFWVLGRVGALLGIASWQMLKIGMLAVALVVPIAGWVLWRRVIGPVTAAAVVVATSLLYQEWYVPQLWLAIAVFVPWWLSFVLGVGRPRGRPLGRGAVAAGIALGAVVATTYWYVLLIGLVQMVLLLATRGLQRRSGRDAEPSSFRDPAWILGGVTAVTAPYWVPVAWSILTTPGARTMQNRYYTAEEVSLPLPFLSFDLEGMVLLGGLVALVATAHRRRVSFHLLGLVGAAYVLYLVGYVAFLVDTPLDTLRTQGVIEFCLAAGAGLGAADLWRAARTWRFGARVDPFAASAVVVVGAVVLVLAFGQRAVRDIPFLSEQRAARYPSQLLEGFARATGGDYEDAVVLTDVTELNSFLPIFVFNTSNAHYSHPSALFDDRADLLTTLAAEPDPDVFALAFLHNRYDDIDFVALREQGDRLGYAWLADAFPNGVDARSITFPASSFASEPFVELEGAPLTMYRVDRDRDPVRTLRRCPERPARDRCQVLDPLLRRYGEHLDDATHDLARRWLAQR